MIIGICGKINSGKDTVGEIIQYLNEYYEVWNLDFENFLDCYNTNKINKYSQWQIKKFADKLKDIVCLLIGCTREQLEDEEFKNKELGEEWIRYGKADGFFHTSNGTIMNNAPCSKEEYEEELKVNWQTAYKHIYTPRTLLQILGSECGRNLIHPDIWVNSLMSEYKNTELVTKHTKNNNPIIGNIDHEYKQYDYPNWIITDVRFHNEEQAVKSRNGIMIKLLRNINTPVTHKSEQFVQDYIDADYTIDNSNTTIEELVNLVKEILIKEKII